MSDTKKLSERLRDVEKEVAIGNNAIATGLLSRCIAQAEAQEKLAYFEARVKPSNDDSEAQTEGLDLLQEASVQMEFLANTLQRQMYENMVSKGKTGAAASELSRATVDDSRYTLNRIVEFLEGRSLPRQKGEVVEAFDKAIAEELPRVSHVQYDSHEICKHFASKVRERLTSNSNP